MALLGGGSRATRGRRVDGRKGAARGFGARHRHRRHSPRRPRSRRGGPASRRGHRAAARRSVRRRPRSSGVDPRTGPDPGDGGHGRDPAARRLAARRRCRPVAPATHLPGCVRAGTGARQPAACRFPPAARRPRSRFGLRTHSAAAPPRGWLGRCRSGRYFPVASPTGTVLEAATIEQIRGELVTAGLATSEDIDRHLRSVEAGQLDLATSPMISAWGRKPLDEQDAPASRRRSRHL